MTQDRVPGIVAAYSFQRARAQASPPYAQARSSPIAAVDGADAVRHRGVLPKKTTSAESLQLDDAGGVFYGSLDWRGR